MKSLSEKISFLKKRRSIFSSSLFTNNKHHRFTYHSQAWRRWTLYQMRWQTSESFYQGGSVLHNSWLSGDACLYIGRDLWHCSKNVSLGVCGEGCWIKNGCRHAEKVGDAVCGWNGTKPGDGTLASTGLLAVTERGVLAAGFSAHRWREPPKIGHCPVWTRANFPHKAGAHSHQRDHARQVGTTHRTDVSDRVAFGLPWSENAVDVVEISPAWSRSLLCKLRTQSPVALTASVSRRPLVSLLLFLR